MNSSDHFRVPPDPSPVPDSSQLANQSSVASPQDDDAALNQALERHPPVQIRDGFVRSVMCALPASENQRDAFSLPRRWAPPAPGAHAAPQTGRRVAFAGACLLFAIVVLLALHMPHAEAGHPIVALALGSTFALEFILLTLWLTLRSDTLS